METKKALSHAAATLYRERIQEAYFGVRREGCDHESAVLVVVGLALDNASAPWHCRVDWTEVVRIAVEPIRPTIDSHMGLQSEPYRVDEYVTETPQNNGPRTIGFRVS